MWRFGLKGLLSLGGSYAAPCIGVNGLTEKQF